MKSFLTYTGETPRHALKMEWTRGKQVGLDVLFEKFGSHCTVSNQLDEAFVRWFFNTYVKGLGADYQLRVSPGDLVAAASRQSKVEVTPVETPDVEESMEEVASEEEASESDEHHEGTVTLEATEVEIASSQEDAEQRLRSLRTYGGSGVTQTHSNPMKTNMTLAEQIKAMPKPGEAVMTGDDLAGADKSANIKSARALVLSEKGEAKKVVATTKEQQARVDRGLSSVSSNAKVLTPDSYNKDGSISRVITDTSEVQAEAGYQESVIFGDDSAEEQAGLVIEEETPKSQTKNRYFQGYSNTGSNRIEISAEDIVDAPTEQDFLRLVRLCKDSTTLRVAKITLKDRGKHDRVTKIETRLRSLPGR